MIEEINDQLSCPNDYPEFGGSEVTEVIFLEWKNGLLAFKVEWGNTITTTWELLKYMQQDYPKMTVRYIVGGVGR